MGSQELDLSEDSLFQACADEFRRYRRRVAAASAGLTGWRDRLRASVCALHRFLDEDERRCRLTIVEARIAGGPAARLLDREIRAFVDLIDEGRAEPAASPGLTRTTAECLGGAVFNEIYLAAARRTPLPPERQFVPGVMYLTVLPFLGETEAATELEICPPTR